ncbi:MAG: putative deacylase [Saprospiraceae bacterium]|jgi:predicted deacylase
MQQIVSNDATYIEKFDIADTPKGKIAHYWMKIASDGFGSPICIPVMVARGVQDGPILGVTAAVHGNELNGISVIQRLFGEIDIEELRGTIVGVPVVNVLAFQRKKRRFLDGTDLNHIMPGKKNGNVSQVYAYRFMKLIANKFEYLLDLHTASTGRINSYYIRADMNDPLVREMALLQNADIIVHNPASDGTLRGSSARLGIKAITVEVGNPNTFQKRLIRSGIEGVHNVLCHLDMIDDEIITSEKETVLCERSKWMYTAKGGFLTVSVELREHVKKGQEVASLRNVFGKSIEKYYAPFEGVVIGKSVDPVNKSGGRILHLGKMVD